MCKFLQTSDGSVHRALPVAPALRQDLHNHQFTTMCPSIDPHPNPKLASGRLATALLHGTLLERSVHENRINCATSQTSLIARGKSPLVPFQHRSRARTPAGFVGALPSKTSHLAELDPGGGCQLRTCLGNPDL